MAGVDTGPRRTGDGTDARRHIEARRLGHGPARVTHCGATRPDDAADGRAERLHRYAVATERQRQLRRADDRIELHAGEQWCDHEHAHIGRQRAEVAGLQSLGHGDAGVGQAAERDDGAQVGSLVPRRRHERLLIALHDLHAEGGGHAGGRIGVELLVPACRDGRVERGGRSVRVAVPRRGQHGLRRRDVVGRVEHVGQRGAEPARQCRIGPHDGFRVERPQCAAETDLSVVGVGQAEPGGREIDRPRTERVGHRPAADGERQRLEVAGGTGGEPPVVVHGQFDRRHVGCQRPRRALCFSWVVAQPGSSTGLERRHDAGDVVGLRGEQPAAHEA